MAASRRYAFHPRLWAYDLGEDAANGRHEFRVIRIRSSESADSKKAAAFQLSPDGSNAGVEFSDEECRVTNVNDNELVMLIGELLLEDPNLRDQNIVPIRSTAEFDPATGQIVQTAEFTHKVVSKLQDKKCNMFILVRKTEGLCAIQPVPRKVYENQIFFYPEFTLAESPQHGERKRKYANYVCAKKVEYIESHSHDFINGARASRTQATTWKISSTETAQSICDAQYSWNEKLMSAASKCLALYNATNDIIHIKNLRRHVDDAHGETLPQHQIAKLSHYIVLINLIEGTDDFNADDAEEAAGVCKEMWKVQGNTIQFSRDAILALGTMLRKGALGDKMITEDTYSVFVGHFCLLYSPKADDEHLRRYIHQASELANLVSGTSSTTKVAPRPNVTSYENARVDIIALLADLNDCRRMQINCIESHLKAIRAQHSSGFGSNTSHDIEQLISGLSTTLDVDEARHLVNQIVHYFSLKIQQPSLRIIELLQDEKAANEKMIEELQASGYSDDGDNEEESSEDGSITEGSDDSE